MKKAIVLLAALAMVAAFATASMAAISGSKHDLSDDSLGTTEMCKFCHIPHNPQSTAAPLWNRTNPANTDFTAYGTTVAGTSIANTDLGAASLVCLSCHDGATNLDAFGGATGTTTIQGKFTTTTANVGTSLTNDHPVGVAATAGTKGMKGTFGSNVTFYSNTVQCSSCHDPHTAVASFLRVSNASSALCLECHDK